MEEQNKRITWSKNHSSSDKILTIKQFATLPAVGGNGISFKDASMFAE